VAVTQQMVMMEPIYQIFEQQLATTERWGETLWKDLNVPVLSDGIDEYLNKTRKLSKPIRALTVSASTSLICFALLTRQRLKFMQRIVNPLTPTVAIWVQL